jgi:hypothetical protein
MRGHDVELAQRALNHSRLGDFYDGPIDGVYGEHTANSARKAKEHLGYAKAGIDRHFDDRLLAYLQGDKHLTPAMRARRVARAKQRRQEKAAGNVFPKAEELGRHEVGTKESPPDSNRVKYSTWYGVIGSWCAMFVSWCMAKAGSKVFAQGRFVAYVPNLLASAHQGHGDMRVVSAEHARHCDRDLALWNFPGEDHHPNHVSFVTRIDGNTVHSLDGNTSETGSQSNGGEVMYRERSISLVEAFVHVSE